MKTSLLTLFLLLPQSLAHAAQPVATILSYHEVDAAPTHDTVARRSATGEAPAESRRYTTTPAQFAAQLDELDALGYTVVPLSHVAEFLAGCRSDLPPKAVVITVDDGWACAYTDIHPEMQRRGLPWTLFIYPKIVGRGAHAVTWPQVAELARDGVDIESHSMTHPFLTATNNHEVDVANFPAFLRDEMIGSRARIESEIPQPVRYFCYPFGDHDLSTADALRQAGYLAAVTTVRAPVTAESDPLRLPRYLIHNTTTLEVFRSFLH